MRLAGVVAAGLAVAMAGMSAAVAQTQPVVFGDWRADSPGVSHMITPDSLPQPYASRSESNSPRIAARPPGALPRVPPGFSVELWASGLAMPRVLRIAPNGDVFLAESGSGRILVFRPGPEGRPSGQPAVFATDLSLPFGIAFWPPAAPRFVYVAATDRVVRYPYSTGDLVARGHAEDVISDLPEGGHWTRDLAVSPDGARLFLSVGSQTNVATSMPAHPPGDLAGWERQRGLGAAWAAEDGRAAVFTFEPDGHVLHPFATGLRNCVGLAIDPATGSPWCATNERDGLGDNLPPDYATHVAAGAFYGWPWFYIGNHEDPRLPGRRPDLAGHVTVPDVLIQPHSAPLGIAFYDAAQFPPAYRGDAFVTLHGSWNRGQRTGYKVIRLRMRDGRPTGGYEDFLTGFVSSDNAVWGRPVGVAVAADGSLLVSEDGNGTIWRIAWRG
jgi:glucose/arabinose dehydrogenase